ncbi:MAG: hypothetical protein ACLFT8_00130, partial [Desulfovermiculus sp.]
AYELLPGASKAIHWNIDLDSLYHRSMSRSRGADIINDHVLTRRDTLHIASDDAHTKNQEPRESYADQRRVYSRAQSQA